MRFHNTAVFAMVLLDRHSGVVHAMPRDWSESRGSEGIHGEAKRDITHQPVPVVDASLEAQASPGATDLVVLDDRQAPEEYVPPYDAAKFRWWMETYLLTFACVLSANYMLNRLFVRFTNQRQRDSIYACIARFSPFTEEQARHGVHAMQDAEQIVMENLPGKRSLADEGTEWYDEKWSVDGNQKRSLADPGTEWYDEKWSVDGNQNDHGPALLE